MLTCKGGVGVLTLRQARVMCPGQVPLTGAQFAAMFGSVDWLRDCRVAQDGELEQAVGDWLSSHDLAIINDHLVSPAATSPACGVDTQAAPASAPAAAQPAVLPASPAVRCAQGMETGMEGRKALETQRHAEHAEHATPPAPAAQPPAGVPPAEQLPAEQPVAEQPGAGQPGAEQPVEGQPVAEQPAAVPRAAQPEAPAQRIVAEQPWPVQPAPHRPKPKARPRPSVDRPPKPPPPRADGAAGSAAGAREPTLAEMRAHLDGV